MLSFKIKDVIFRSPVIAASGTFGYGDEISKFVDISKIGSIITKSITLDSRKGNPSPRIHGIGSGMLNSIGLANMGVEQFCSRKLAKLNILDTNFIISVAGSSFEEYCEVISIIEKEDGGHVGYELNISCPNVKNGGMEFGVSPEETKNLVRNLRDLTSKLLFVKLSPNVTDIASIAKAAEAAGADAICAVNTFRGLALDYMTGKTLVSTKYGGISGAPIKPLALAKAHEIYNKVQIPVIGMGGITSMSDIIEFIRVGASMVQIGTLNYRDPAMISTFYDLLKDFLNQQNISNLKDIRGNIS